MTDGYQWKKGVRIKENFISHIFLYDVISNTIYYFYGPIKLTVDKGSYNTNHVLLTFCQTVDYHTYTVFLALLYIYLYIYFLFSLLSLLFV